MSIIKGASNNLDLSNGIGYFLAPQYLFGIIRRATWLIGTVLCVCTLIAMLFIDKSDVLAERKRDFKHKLLVIFLMTGFVSIMNFIYFVVHTLVA